MDKSQSNIPGEQMSDSEHPFGDAFGDLEGMMEAMKQMAQMNRATYTAHIEAGFTPFEAMELTKFTLQTIFAQFNPMLVPPS
jgi:hypothetical protein